MLGEGESAAIKGPCSNSILGAKKPEYRLSEYFLKSTGRDSNAGGGGDITQNLAAIHGDG